MGATEIDECVGVLIMLYLTKDLFYEASKNANHRQHEIFKKVETCLACSLDIMQSPFVTSHRWTNPG